MEFGSGPYAPTTTYYPLGPVDNLDMIDPKLRDSMLATPVGGAAWGRAHCPPLSSADHSSPAVWPFAMMNEPMSPEWHPGRDGVSPMPVGHQYNRPDSPSFTYPSSTCSGSYSPGHESDRHFPRSPGAPGTPNSHSPFMPSEGWGLHPSGIDRGSACAEGFEVDNYQHQGLPPPPMALGSSERFKYDFQEYRLEVPASRDQYPRDGVKDNHNNSMMFQVGVWAQDDAPNAFYHRLSADAEDLNQNYTHDPAAHYLLSRAADGNSVKEEVEDNNNNTNQGGDDRHPSRRLRGDVVAPGPATSTSPRNKKRRGANPPSPPQQLKKPKREGGGDKLACHVCGGGDDDATPFHDEQALQKHMRAYHTRPFTCVFHFAGCTSTFASKNEWKRHCQSQHLVLRYWLCDLQACARQTNHHHHHNPMSTLPPYGAIFNRKDLYTQHLRRMHVPADVKKDCSSGNNTNDKNKSGTSSSGRARGRKESASSPNESWEEAVRQHQRDAEKERCSLPTFMACPAPGCGATFEGSNAWDDRMEHVARHLDRAAEGLEATLEFGGSADSSLVDWASRPDVAVIVPTTAGGWVLNNPLKPSPLPSALMGAYAPACASRQEPETDEEADAEGELDD